ncbi:MAG: ABC transporter substrate-binding protein, partial [Chloroflexota bacterium]
MRSRGLIVAAVGGVLLALLGGVWLWQGSRLVPDHGGTYVEAAAGRPQYINPLLAQFNELDRDLSSLVFAGLVKIGPSGRVEPDIAESWEISPDGKTYTFRLRADRKWHDGKPVVADDVLYTIRTLQAPEFPGLPDLALPWRGVKVEKVDDRTVRFVLAEPYAPLLEQAGLGLLPAHILGNVPAANLADQAFNGSPIGAGPFKVLKASVQQVVLVADQAYPGPKPYIESLIFRFYPSSRAVITALQNGEVSAARVVPAADVAQLRQSQDLQLVSA